MGSSRLPNKVLLPLGTHSVLAHVVRRLKHVGSIHTLVLATTEASWTHIGKLTSYSTTLYGSAGTLLIEPNHDGHIRLATTENPDGIALTVPEQPAHLENASTHFLAAIEDPDLEIHPLCEAHYCRGSQWILEEGIRVLSGTE